MRISTRFSPGFPPDYNMLMLSHYQVSHSLIPLPLAMRMRLGSYHCTLIWIKIAFLYTDLESTIASAYTPSPTVSCITYMWDIHTWLKPHIPQLHDHLKAHHFKIVMTEVGTCMFYKEWSSDDFWLPEDGLALLMENNEQLFPSLTTLPPIIKTFIKPDEISGIQTMVHKLSGYLRKGGHHNWWESWLHSQTEGGN